MKFAAFNVHEDLSFQENFARETIDAFVLREKFRQSRMNPACVSLEKYYFPRIYPLHLCKGKLEHSRKLFCKVKR